MFVNRFFDKIVNVFYPLQSLNALIISAIFILSASSCQKSDGEYDVCMAELDSYYTFVDSTLNTVEKNEEYDYLAGVISESPTQPQLEASLYRRYFEARMYAFNNEYSKAIDILLDVKAQCLEIQLYPVFGKSCKYLGFYYSNILEYNQAVVHLKDGIANVPSDSFSILSELYFLLARNYYILDSKSDDAFTYIDKAIEQAHLANNEQMVAQYSCNKATIYQARGEYDRAQEYLDLASAYYSEDKLKDSKINQKYYVHLTSCLMDQCSVQGDVRQVIENGKRTIRLAEKYEVDRSVFVSNLGNNYYEINELDSAVVYIRKFFELVKNEEKDSYINRRALHRSYEYLCDIYRQQNNWEAAYNLNSEYLAQKDIFYKQDSEASVIETERKYDNAIKEKEVEQLNKEVQLQERQLISIVILACLIVAIIYLVLKSMYAKRHYQQELQKAYYAQRLLRSQMTPHFILNTITSIQYYIRRNENKLANKYLLQFSRLLQTNLENSAEAFVSLSKELDAIRNYLELQTLRFGALFTYRIINGMELNDELIFIPPMLIQPFVENSIIHGFKGVKDGGLITISIEKKEQCIYCIIEDNGVGKHTSTRESGRQSMSGEIIKERLSLIGKEMNQMAGVSVINKEDVGLGSGYKVELTIPYKQ